MRVLSPDACGATRRHQRIHAWRRVSWGQIAQTTTRDAGYSLYITYIYIVCFFLFLTVQLFLRQLLQRSCMQVLWVVFSLFLDICVHYLLSQVSMSLEYSHVQIQGSRLRLILLPDGLLPYPRFAPRLVLCWVQLYLV